MAPDWHKVCVLLHIGGRGNVTYMNMTFSRAKTWFERFSKYFVGSSSSTSSIFEDFAGARAALAADQKNETIRLNAEVIVLHDKWII